MVDETANTLRAELDHLRRLVDLVTDAGVRAELQKMIEELERRLRVTEPVIKFLTVRIDLEQKRLDKIKKLRESRRKLSAEAPPAAAAEAPAAPAAEAPATA